MRFAFIMDPLDGVNAKKDTSYFLMLAARELGHEVFYLNHHDLVVLEGEVGAPISAVDVHADITNPFTVLDQRHRPLGDMDVVLVRTDPPFDRRYFYMTLLLDLLPASTRVVNRPSGLRNWNEKLAAVHFPHLTPKTLVSRDADEINSFAREVGRLTLKPIDGHGGAGIRFMDADDGSDAIDDVTHKGSHWIIAQAYLPEARQGDKRVLILNGEPLGAILRLHAADAELNNLDQGGTANPVELNQADLDICAALKPGLLEQGIVFSGIDVIGDRLIEVNVTSPTGLQELCRFTDTPFHHRIIQHLCTRA